MKNIKKLSNALNNWVENNPQSEINFNFKEDSLYDEDTIKKMEKIYWYIKQKPENKKSEVDLMYSISRNISDFLKIIGDKEREKLIQELEKSGGRVLKYEITEEMLVYTGYNKTKFKDIEGIYGLLKLN